MLPQQLGRCIQIPRNSTTFEVSATSAQPGLQHFKTHEIQSRIASAGSARGNAPATSGHGTTGFRDAGDC